MNVPRSRSTLARSVRGVFACAIVVGYVCTSAVPALTDAGHAIFHAFAEGAVRYGGLGSPISMQAHSHAGLPTDDPHLAGDHLSGDASDHTHALIVDALLAIAPSGEDPAVGEAGSAPAPPAGDLHVPVVRAGTLPGPDPVLVSAAEVSRVPSSSSSSVPVPPPRA